MGHSQIFWTTFKEFQVGLDNVKERADELCVCAHMRVYVLMGDYVPMGVYVLTWVCMCSWVTMYLWVCVCSHGCVCAHGWLCTNGCVCAHMGVYVLMGVGMCFSVLSRYGCWSGWVGRWHAYGWRLKIKRRPNFSIG